MPNNVVDFTKIVNEGLPLAVFLKNEGINAYKIVTKMLDKFCNSFNVVRNMTIEQKADYSFVLIDSNMHGALPTCPSYRLEDLAVFFEKAKTGVYGVPFDHLDCSVIEGMLDKYHQERVKEYYNSKYEIKKQDTKEITQEEKQNVVKCLQEISESLKHKDDEPSKENSLEEQELIRLQSIENRKKDFYGKYYDKNTNSETLERIESLKKKIEENNKG